MVHDSDASFNDNYFPNATSSDVSYTAETITIEQMDISNGYGGGLSSSNHAEYYFNAAILGSGDINFYNWSSTSCYQEYIFTGNLSNYSGDITSGKADNVSAATYSGGLFLTFTGTSSSSASGTGSIYLNGSSSESITYSYSKGATITNERITAPVINLGTSYDYADYYLASNITAKTLNIAMCNDAHVMEGYTLNLTTLVLNNNTNLFVYGTFNLSGTANYDSSRGIYNYGETNLLSGSKVMGPIINHGELNVNSGASTSGALLNYGTLNIARGSSISTLIQNYSTGTLVLESGATLTASSSLSLQLDGTIVVNEQSQILVSDSSAISLSSGIIFDLSSATGQWTLNNGLYTFQLFGDADGDNGYDISSLSLSNFIGLNSFGSYSFNSDGSISFDLGDADIVRYTGANSFNWGTAEPDVLFTNSATGTQQSFSNGLALSIEVDTHATLTSNVSTHMISLDGIEFTLTGNGNKLSALQFVFAGDSTLILTDDALSSATSVGTGSNSAGIVQFSATDANTVFNYGEQLKTFCGQVILDKGTLQLGSSISESFQFSHLTVNGGSFTGTASLDVGELVFNDGTSSFDGVIAADRLSTTGGTNSLSGSITLGSLNYSGGSLTLGGVITLSSLSTSSDGSITLSDNSRFNLVDSSAAWIKLDNNLTFTLGNGVSMDVDETIWTRGNLTFSLAESNYANPSASVDMNQLLVGYSKGSSLLTIGEGVTLTVSGTVLKSSGTDSSFILSGHSEGGNVDVCGTLILNSGIMNFSGDGTLRVKDGGTLVLNAGLAAEVAGESLSMNIESGATVSLGNQADSSVDYGTIMSITLMDGATISDNGVDATTTLKATLNYESGATINLASSGKGKTLLMGMNVAGDSLSANIQGEGLVELAAGATLNNLSLEKDATLKLSSNVTVTTASIAAGATVQADTALNLGASASIINEGTLLLKEGSTLSISAGQSLNISGSISVTEAGQIINDGTLILSDDFVFDLTSLQESAWDYDISTGVYSLSLVAGDVTYDLSRFDSATNLTGFDSSNKNISFNSDGSLSYILSSLVYQRGGELTLQIGSSLSTVDGSKEILYRDSASIYFTTADSQVTLAENIFSTLWAVYDVDLELTGDSYVLVTDQLTLNGSASLTLKDDALHSDVRLYQAADADSELIIAMSHSSTTLNYAKQLSSYTGDITLSSGMLNLVSQDVAGYNFDVITLMGTQLLMSGTSTANELNMSSGGSIRLSDGASLTVGGGAVGNSSDAFMDNLVKHTGDITLYLGSGALLDQNIRMWLDTGVNLTLNATNSDANAQSATYRINELLLRYTSTGDTETSLTIGRGTELEITGTTTATADANSSFIISGHSDGTSLVTVEGQLTLNSGIVSMGGSSNVINVEKGGTLQANAGLVAYDSSDSAVEIELNMAAGSTLLLGNQATKLDHSDALNVKMASDTTIGTNGIDKEVYVYQSFNFEEGGSYTFDVASKSYLSMMQSIEISEGSITVTGGGSTKFVGGLSTEQITVQKSATAVLGGTSSLSQIIGGADGGIVQIHSTDDGSQLMLGSLALSGGSISLAEGASMSENRMQDVSLEGVTMAIAKNMYMASSSIGQQSTVSIADGATLSLGEQISISSASAGGATITMNQDSSLSDSYMSNTALSYLSLDNADVRITSNADTDNLLLQRITTNANSSLTITSGSKINVTGFSSYLRGSTIIESGAEANMGTMCAIYGRFEAQDNSKLVFGGGSFNSGASLYLGKGVQMEAVNTKFNTGATLYLDGAAITLQDRYRWFYSDIVITGAGNSISGTTTFLGLASELSYSQAWTGSDDWTLNLDGNAQLSINYVFSIDFSVDGEASLGAGSYTIFSNVANDCTSSLTADMVSGVLRDDYELVWRYEDGNIILDVIDMSELIWSDAEQTWVDGLGNQAVPDSNQSLSFDTGTISGGSATLSDSIEASGISIKGDEDVHIMGDVTLSSQSNITKSGAGTAVVEAQLSATQGLDIEQGRLELSQTGRITSDTQVAQGASLKAGAITLTGKEGAASIGVSAGGSISCDEMGYVQISNATLVVDGIAQISNSSLEASSTQITAGSQLVLDGVHIAANSQFSTSISYLKANSQAAQLSLMGANTIDASSSGGSLSISDGVYTLMNLMEVDTIALDGSLSINLILSEQEMLDFNIANQSLQGVSFIIMDGVIEGQLNDLIINVGIMVDGIYDATCVYQGGGDLNNGVLSVTLNGDDNVPEPSTVSLSLMALAGMLARRRRRA
ncbi:MAG: PEP-CTERM sorting domain-containing protein [Akkermansia sp.]